MHVTVDGKTRTFNGRTGIVIQWQNTRYWKSGKAATTVSVAHAANNKAGRYRHGRLEVKVIGGKLTVVNVVRLNTEYLYGIAEMPASWPAAALQSQAVAARTYAHQRRETLRADCDCHVYDDTRSQVFAGYANEAGKAGAPWVSAVNATVTRKSGSVSRSRVVMHRGKLIQALYSSSSAGQTNPNADVWGSNVAYLQSRSDAAAFTSGARNPYAKWTVDVTRAKMESAFGLSGITSIDASYTATGMVKTLTARSASGKSKTLTGPQARTKLGLRSATFTLKPTG